MTIPDDSDPDLPTSFRRQWWWLSGAVLLAFLILGFYGGEVYRQAPPIPEQVVTPDGTLLFTQDGILDGQEVWQSVGGQQVGSIWGHGAYQAPDWSADWLHREAIALLELWAQREHDQTFDQLDEEAQAPLQARLRRELRTNTHDAETGAVTVSADRAAAMAAVAAHYDALFGTDPALESLREDYALHRNAVPEAERRAALGAFFWWTSWACATERPDSEVSYTNNWPHEALIGNVPTAGNVLWSIVSVVLLLAGIGALIYWKAFRERHEADPDPPAADPLDRITITPSMRAAARYGLVATGLFVLQVLLGAVTAHYTVEGHAFFGFTLSDILPYATTRTWHVQLGIFWIATAFLAFGLFLAPAIGGREPRFQCLGVNVLLGALVVVVLGSLFGEWMAVQQQLPGGMSFWFGHQGYEYVDLGRAWQIALFGGILLWLVLMLRGLWPAFRQRDDARQITLLFTASVVAIGLFYGFGLFYGARTHLSVMEYWRWWVIHLWVEGFFEVFATAAIAFVFARLGLVTARSAARACLFSATIFLFAGIPGTFHHLYFSGTPVSIMAVGASFSALEVVPLVLIGFEAAENLRYGRHAGWVQRYRWPIRFFVTVAFWNLVGAGLFGFLINPPLALYYMQGLNTTPVHAHTALFGVYGLLSLGFILIILRRMDPESVWNDRPLTIAYWFMNGGLALMVLLSLLPIGLAQTWASIDQGLWYARSAEFLQQPALETLRWLRIVGDTAFLLGVGAFACFVIGRYLALRRPRPAPGLAPATLPGETAVLMQECD